MTMPRSRVRTIRHIFETNPAGIALWLVTSRLWTRLRSSLLAHSLKAPGLHLGPGCRVIGGRYIRFGRGVRSQRDLWLEAVSSYESQSFRPEIYLGNDVRFSDSVHLSAIERIVIGDHTLVGSRVYIADHSHGIYSGDNQSSPDEIPRGRLLGGGGPVTIGRNVWIGDNSVILGPTAIGDGAIIGANSVVKGNVDPNCIVAGAPAKVLKRFNASNRSWERK
jgi:acetyltransferase-like isoleucine patch superfamily enzyme